MCFPAVPLSHFLLAIRVHVMHSHFAISILIIWLLVWIRYEGILVSLFGTYNPHRVFCPCLPNRRPRRTKTHYYLLVQVLVFHAPTWAQGRTIESCSNLLPRKSSPHCHSSLILPISYSLASHID